MGMPWRAPHQRSTGLGGPARVDMVLPMNPAIEAEGSGSHRHAQEGQRQKVSGWTNGVLKGQRAGGVDIRP